MEKWSLREGTEMCELLIFGGTTEGRELAEYCCEKRIRSAVCVATDYGAELLPVSEYLRIITGRLDSSGMEKLISELKCKCVIDATHPYATEVTANIKAACTVTQMPYYRLLRSSSETTECRKVRNMEQLVEVLNSTEKKVLSTLGSKEIPKLTAVKKYRERLWVRVLSNEDIIEQCKKLGIDRSRVIAEKGPFSTERNIEHLKLSGAEILVTKESGTTGGFPEKIEAARLCGAEVIVLERPVEKGYTLDEIIKIISE
ncbi:MAG: precorrin-6A reductase [Ruminococcus sp.]|uniref:precorrin-6A reductase n=1 Tax=Ruminococcus sp. TaxID=41978 RepID=UPI0025E856D2|nr:precorrin-6A reductase [Ruminococcus sp.]MCR4796571.1 precorrin-6A reductase [Ruminococcus sp.]